MKKLLILGMLLMVALPLMAEEIVITPEVVPFSGGTNTPTITPPGELELSWDDGEDVSSYFSEDYVPYATTFTAPSDCWLVKYRLYWYNGGDADVDCLYYEDDGGNPPTPTGDTLWTVIGNSGSTSYDWFEVDVSGEGQFITNGTIFHPGWSHAYTNGGVMLDDPVPDSYACWLWLGYWYDFSAYYTHMVRVVINDDTDPPYVDQQNPPDGGDGYPDTDIVFHVIDDDIGVDTSTIDFTAEDESKSMAGNKLASAFVVKTSKGVVPGSLDIDDADPNDVICTFTPDSDLPIGDTITCTVATGLADLLTNATDTDIQWSFEVIPYEGIESKSLGSIKTEFE